MLKTKVEIKYKYKGQTEETQGLSFQLGNHRFKGSEIDRKFSIKGLEKQLNENQNKMESKPRKLLLGEQNILAKNEHKEPNTATSSGKSMDQSLKQDQDLSKDFKEAIKELDKILGLLMRAEKDQSIANLLPNKWKDGERKRRKRLGL